MKALLAVLVLACAAQAQDKKSLEDAGKDASGMVKQEKKERQHRERRSYPSSVGFCKDPGPERDADDAQRAKVTKEYAYGEGMLVRTAILKEGDEFDCREFVIEECFNLDEKKSRVGFSFDFVRTETADKIAWSVENLKGVKWDKPHRFEAPKAGGDFAFLGEDQAQFKAPCAIAWINGYLKPIEATKGDTVAVKLIQYTHKKPDDKE